MRVSVPSRGFGLLAEGQERIRMAVADLVSVPSRGFGLLAVAGERACYDRLDACFRPLSGIWASSPIVSAQIMPLETRVFPSPLGDLGF